jgi:hypothetical protein
MEVVDQRISVIKTSVSNPDTERIHLCLKKLSIARRARSKAVKMAYDARQSSLRKSVPPGVARCGPRRRPSGEGRNYEKW